MRGAYVTGFQTCALPISSSSCPRRPRGQEDEDPGRREEGAQVARAAAVLRGGAAAHVRPRRRDRPDRERGGEGTSRERGGQGNATSERRDGVIERSTCRK